MDIDKHHKVIVPFLTGQRRDGLCRILEIDNDTWDVLEINGLEQTLIADPDEKIRRMGEIYSRLSTYVEGRIKEGSVPISLAGDCVVTLGVLAGLQNADRQPDRILWLDAHGDFHTWETTQTNYIGGMPLAMLVGRGDLRIVEAVGLQPYPENRIVLSDARDLDPGEREAIRASEIVRCNFNDVLGHLPPGQSLYLHWDTDVVDAEAEMPALKYHVKSGPSYSKLSEFFESLRNRNIVAISVSAWHEEQDRDNRTARACLQLLEKLM